ncbi:hypothetical protein E2C01_095147 [Portunus trituberculatus]|uniref:Uncharacterized protein n=1 Tax=Portunus trituberculatus TaxID=210409 RepID=A0A5B7K2Z7_PORTR|nr:hypothetical protein [Portunus trituberculatus]
MTTPRPDCFSQLPLCSLLPLPLRQDGNSAQHQEAVADWSAEVKKMMTLMRTVFNQEQKEKYLSTVMEQVRKGTA